MSRLRISPAHAGNTRPCSCGVHNAADQPRTCGEYSLPLPLPLPGSAPHMRGILGASAKAAQLRGISPAHAGNTQAHERLLETSEDQPRTCGEYRGAG